MGAGHSSHDKVEKLFRQNVRSSRSRSLDVRTGASLKTSIESPRRSVFTQSVRYKDGRRYRANSKTQYDAEITVCTTGLSRIQKRNLDLAWARTPERQKRQLTEDIFLAILQRDPQLIKLFRLDDVQWNRIRTNDYFRSHSSNFLTVVDLTITNLNDNLEQVCDALQVLGYQHVVLRERGWNPEYWSIFESVFSSFRPDTLNDADGVQAWNILIAFMLRQMKVGFRRGEQDEQRPKDTNFLRP